MPLLSNLLHSVLEPFPDICISSLEFKDHAFLPLDSFPEFVDPPLINSRPLSCLMPLKPFQIRLFLPNKTECVSLYSQFLSNPPNQSILSSSYPSPRIFLSQEFVHLKGESEFCFEQLSLCVFEMCLSLPTLQTTLYPTYRLPDRLETNTP